MENKHKMGLKKAGTMLGLVAGILILWQVEERYGTREDAAVNTYPQIISTKVPEDPVEKSTKKPAKKPARQEVVPTRIPEIETFVNKNKDVIGYISIPDTNVDYPVLMGKDNEYYLNHDIDKKQDKAACIMADYKYSDTNIREEFQRHTLIYGHYLLKKTMFTSISKYKDQEFFETHPYIYYSNLYKTGKWKVFSVYVVDADKETLPRKISDDKAYLSFLKDIKERSLYKSDVSLTKDSKIVTLCTCSYETKNSRTIVHAVLADE